MRVYRDILTKKFGRDIAGIIYRIIWNTQMSFINKQYKSLLVGDLETGGIEFVDTYYATGRPTFVFNTRDDYSFYRGPGIYRWNARFDRQAPDLPKHYWEIPELY